MNQPNQDDADESMIKLPKSKSKNAYETPVTYDESFEPIKNLTLNIFNPSKTLIMKELRESELRINESPLNNDDLIEEDNFSQENE